MYSNQKQPAIPYSKRNMAYMLPSISSGGGGGDGSTSTTSSSINQAENPFPVNHITQNGKGLRGSNGSGGDASGGIFSGIYKKFIFNFLLLFL